MATAFDGAGGTVDVVVLQPAVRPARGLGVVAPEARDHDPHLALFSGPRRTRCDPGARAAGRDLLRPGGVVGVEHADVQGARRRTAACRRCFAATGRWAEVRDHADLTGRPRFTTARLAP